MTINPEITDLSPVYLCKHHFKDRANSETQIGHDLRYALVEKLESGTHYVSVSLCEVIVNPIKVENGIESLQESPDKFLVIIENEGTVEYRLYDKPLDKEVNLDDYTVVDIDNDYYDVFNSIDDITSESITLGLYRKGDKYIPVLFNRNYSIGFEINTLIGSTKKVGILEISLFAFKTNFKDNTTTPLKGFKTITEVPLSKDPFYSKKLTRIDIAENLKLLIYSIFNFNFNINDINLGVEQNEDDNTTEFCIRYNVDKVLCNRYSNEVIFSLGTSAQKILKFSVKRNSSRDMNKTIINFVKFKDKLKSSNYGYTPAKLNKNVEEMIIKDFCEFTNTNEVFYKL